MSEEIVSVILVPKTIFEKARELADNSNYEEALKLLEENKTEVEVNEHAKQISMKIPRPRTRPPESYYYYQKHGKRQKLTRKRLVKRDD